MEPVFSNYPQDTLSFDVTAETAINNDTVRIDVPVNAMVQDGVTEDALRASIKETLKKFIDAEWQFGAIQRTEGADGIERVSLIATTRVNERENHNLKQRAQQVSVRGMQLGTPQVDYTMPNDKVQEAHRTLRAALMKQIKDEVAALHDLTNVGYRIHSVAFGQQYAASSNRGVSRMAGVMMASASYESAGADASGEDLSHSAKILMTASVVLAHDFLTL